MDERCDVLRDESDLASEPLAMVANGLGGRWNESITNFDEEIAETKSRGLSVR